jgi:hypothetical protein
MVAECTRTEGCQLVRQGPKPQIAYLNIDAFLENQYVLSEFYSDKSTLLQKLKESGCIVKQHFLRGDEEVESNKINQKSREQQIELIIDKLQSLNNTDPAFLLEDKFNPLSPIQREIVKEVIKLSKYIDAKKLLPLIKKAGKQRDMRSLNNLFCAANYVIMHINHPYKRIIRHYFPLGKTLSPEQLLERWNKVFMECSILKKMTTSTQAVRFTKLHFKTVKRKKDKGLHTIVLENPFGFELHLSLPLEEANNDTIGTVATNDKEKKRNSDALETTDATLTVVDEPSSSKIDTQNQNEEFDEEYEDIELSDVLSYSEFLESLPEEVFNEMMDMIDDDQEGFLDEVEVDYDNIPDDVLEEMDKSYYRLMVESGDISDDV